MQQANYLNTLICECAPDSAFAQDAIEWAIVSGNISLTYNLSADVKIVMTQYDEIIESFRPELTRVEVFDYSNPTKRKEAMQIGLEEVHPTKQLTLNEAIKQLAMMRNRVSAELRLTDFIVTGWGTAFEKQGATYCLYPKWAESMATDLLYNELCTQH